MSTGVPGQSLREHGARKYGAATASRGSFIEQATARALEHWLSRRPDCAGLHLFHDLGGFRDVAGHGLPPVRLGAVNIDHVVLSGARWLLVDAKGTGAGTLTIDSAGKGVLIQADGTERPEPWLDSTRTRAPAGVLVRLTGLRGWPVWVVPDATKHDPEVLKARAFRPGGAICTISDVYRAVAESDPRENDLHEASGSAAFEAGPPHFRGEMPTSTADFPHRRSRAGQSATARTRALVRQRA